ncbi:OLC1v1027747C1 [Oldenlandia corymbosa var. corymbosa]|uniref:OLC1v1027747C1 n=1 Tax=Oldenlandia corymbosa var. corymbosa TaxID=529605 RepID=A0AAV1CBC1_OLDCO|nr:OLC1v1027747C1 [Oldenlandia corymbosa var. corymbosa]
MTGASGTSCGACKFLRRRCSKECIFAPYFCYEQAASHFEAVHRVFGASNVSKLLLHLPVPDRAEAALTISYEALARMQDPVYGCVAHIFALQQQVACLKEEIELIGNHMAATLAFDVGSCESYQFTEQHSNSELAMSSTDVNQESNKHNNTVNGHIGPIGHTGNFSASDGQVIGAELPQENAWEEAISFLCSDSNISEMFVQEFQQTLDDHQYFWTDNNNWCISGLI